MNRLVHYSGLDDVTAETSRILLKNPSIFSVFKGVLQLLIFYCKQRMGVRGLFWSFLKMFKLKNSRKNGFFQSLFEKKINKTSYIPGGAFSAPGVFQQCCGAINWGCWGCWCCCCTGICCGAVNAVGWGAVEVWERKKIRQINRGVFSQNFRLKISVIFCYKFQV